MKNFLAFIIAVTSFLPTNAQQVTFEKWYDYGFAEAGYCVQQTPDSGYIVAGRQGISFFSSKMLFLKTDKYGNTEWTTLLGDGSYDSYAYYIINCSAGGYAAVGYLTGQGFVSDVYVVRLDNNGDTLWTKQYGTTAIEEGTSIQETDNGDFVISFWSSDSTGILRINSAGDFLWWKKYKFYNGGHFKNVAVLSTGNYLLAGVVQTLLPLHSQGILMMTDSLGDSLWVRYYGGISGEEFYEAQETTDGNIIVGGISGEAATNSQWGSYVLKINMLGDTLWTKRYIPEYSDGFVSIFQCNDGGYIGCGTSIDSNGEFAIYITKINQNGDSLWTKKFGSFQDKEYGFFVRQTYDGGYIITGMTSNSVDVYLIKTDSLGNLITGISEIPSHDLDFTIYPNPTRNFIYIKSNEEIDKLKLFDTNSRILITNAFNKSKETTMDLSGFSSGVYYLHVQTSKGVAARKIIKN